MTLEQFFSEHPRVAIAFSGGVDSAYLLYAAKQYARSVRAYYVKSAFQPQFEFDDAKKLAQELDAEMVILPVDVLSANEITDNPANRCYYCKRRIFTRITEAAQADGFAVLLDGTNASDDVNDRPGMKALTELSVLSPLRSCGLTKEEIRRLSKEAGLFTWDKPAYACLATRIPTGAKITEANLARTEEAEAYLFSLGFSDFRIRTVGESGKLQLRAADFPLYETKKEEIAANLKRLYEDVWLDSEVRR